MRAHYGKRRVKQKKLSRRLFIYGMISLAFLFFVGLGYLVIYSGIFQAQITVAQEKSLSNVNESDLLNQIKPAVISNIFSSIVGTNNYLAWSSKENNYQAAAAANLKINKDLFKRQIIINATPRDRFAVWCSNDEESKCYWVDQNGTLFEPAPKTAGQFIPYIRDNSDRVSLAIDTPALVGEQFFAAKSVIEGIREMKLPVHSFVVNRAKQEITAKTISGMDLIFSLRFDPTETALPAARTIIEEQGIHKLKYINLTVEKRAFYRNR